MTSQSHMVGRNTIHLACTTQPGQRLNHARHRSMDNKINFQSVQKTQSQHIKHTKRGSNNLNLCWRMGCDYNYRGIKNNDKRHLMIKPLCMIKMTSSVLLVSQNGLSECTFHCSCYSGHLHTQQHTLVHTCKHNKTALIVREHEMSLMHTYAQVSIQALQHTLKVNYMQCVIFKCLVTQFQISVKAARR